MILSFLPCRYYCRQALENGSDVSSSAAAAADDAAAEVSAAAGSDDADADCVSLAWVIAKKVCQCPRNLFDFLFHDVLCLICRISDCCYYCCCDLWSRHHHLWACRQHYLTCGEFSLCCQIIILYQIAMMVLLMVAIVW